MHVDNLRKVDPDVLDQLGVASVTYWHSELERHHVAQRRRGAGTRYLVARDAGGRAAGLLPVYTVAPPFEPIVDPGAIFDPPVPVTGSPLCLAGSPGAYANFLQLSSTTRGPDAARASASLLERARALAREAGSHHVLVPYLNEEQSRWLDAYEADATAVSTRETAVLPVTWTSFDGYLSWLPSKRRREVRRERRILRDSGTEVREERLAKVAADLAPLLAGTENRYGRDVTAEQMEFYLMMLAVNLDDECVTLVGYRDQRPVAFSLILACADRWVARCFGRDYAASDGNALYFNLVYYEPIARAVERGATAIDYGTGSLQAKKLRGCDLHPLRTLLIPSGPAPAAL
jgi:predicted N-acyltransferase